MRKGPDGNVVISPALLRRVNAVAAAERMQVDELVETALRECVNAYDAQPISSARTLGDAVFYTGPSLLNGEPIVGVATGISRRTLNAKTGPIVQTWILRRDMPPQEAVRQNRDDAICGDCALRGNAGIDRRCYVAPWLAPNNVYRLIRRDGYPEADWSTVRELVAGRSLRLGAYGDPAAIPFDVWQQLVRAASGWIGYTHQWRRCDPRFRSIVMASVDSVAEFHEAQAAGWRTFRVRLVDEPLIARRECVCPASDESGHRTTCERCQLCRGLNRPARSIAIFAHGHNGAMTAFYRNRDLERIV